MNTSAVFKVGDKIKHIEYGGKVIESIVDEILVGNDGKIGYHTTPIENTNDKLLGYVVKEKDIIS